MSDREVFRVWHEKGGHVTLEAATKEEAIGRYYEAIASIFPGKEIDRDKIVRPVKVEKLQEIVSKECSTVRKTDLKDDVLSAIGALYNWQVRGGTNFTCRLYQLMHKADRQNLSKLAEAFPAEYLAYHSWLRAGNKGFDLFREYKDSIEQIPNDL